MQIRQRSQPPTGELKKSWIDFGRIHGCTVGIVGQKESCRAPERAGFDDGLKAASPNKIDKDQLPEALTIERATPDVEAFGF